jgi:hypothetical protein
MRRSSTGRESSPTPGARAPQPPVLRAQTILRVLEEHRVAYVVIGGIGARLWGSPRTTVDLDVCAAGTRLNKKRLAAALAALNACVRPPGLEQGSPPPGGWDERSFDGLANVATTTDLGWLDVWFVPDGTGGYDDLIRSAARAELGDGMTVTVADIKAIIRSKAAAGRNKDLEVLNHLRELERRRDELGKREP